MKLFQIIFCCFMVPFFCILLSIMSKFFVCCTIYTQRCYSTDYSFCFHHFYMLYLLLIYIFFQCFLLLYNYASLQMMCRTQNCSSFFLLLIFFFKEVFFFRCFMFGYNIFTSFFCLFVCLFVFCFCFKKKKLIIKRWTRVKFVYFVFLQPLWLTDWIQVAKKKAKKIVLLPKILNERWGKEVAEGNRTWKINKILCSFVVSLNIVWFFSVYIWGNFSYPPFLSVSLILLSLVFHSTNL